MTTPLDPLATAQAHRKSLDVLHRAVRFHETCPAEFAPAAQIFLERAKADEAEARRAWISTIVRPQAERLASGDRASEGGPGAKPRNSSATS